jgi:hypothetical protein
MMNARDIAKVEGNKRLFAKVARYAKELNEIFARNPADAEDVVRLVAAQPGLSPLHDIWPSLPGDGNPEQWEAVIIYKDLWSGQSESLGRAIEIEDKGVKFEGTASADPRRFAPHPTTGRVDMSQDLFQGRPGYSNYNYAWYDPETDTWWGANRHDYDPLRPMRVKQMTHDHLFTSCEDFDTSVFAIAVVPRSAWPGFPARRRDG